VKTSVRITDSCVETRTRVPPTTNLSKFIPEQNEHVKQRGCTRATNARYSSKVHSYLLGSHVWVTEFSCVTWPALKKSKIFHF
jgi:hypothetical protein